MKKLKPNEARQQAIEAICSCFESERAGGFESADNAGVEWPESEPEIISQNDLAFHMTIGGVLVRFVAEVPRNQGLAKKD